jgi:hypothetical protein
MSQGPATAPASARLDAELLETEPPLEPELLLAVELVLEPALLPETELPVDTEPLVDPELPLEMEYVEPTELPPPNPPSAWEDDTLARDPPASAVASPWSLPDPHPKKTVVATKSRVTRVRMTALISTTCASPRFSRTARAMRLAQASQRGLRETIVNRHLTLSTSA